MSLQITTADDLQNVLLIDLPPGGLEPIASGLDEDRGTLSTYRSVRPQVQSRACALACLQSCGKGPALRSSLPGLQGFRMLLLPIPLYSSAGASG